MSEVTRISEFVRLVDAGRTRQKQWGKECDVTTEILQGDALEMLRTLPAASVHCCVTSPPYWGLRDYGVKGQLGLEGTPEEYVAKMVAVFAEVYRVLRDEGTLWLNLGDSYYGSWANYGGGNRGAGKHRPIRKGNNALNPVWEGMEGYRPAATYKHATLKSKDLVGIPWRVAFALQNYGWYLRQDVIWNKLNPMPESVIDRCTKAHEYIFMFSKSRSYYYDHDAIKEPAIYSGIAGMDESGFKNAAEFNGKHGKAAKSGKQRRDKQRGHGRRHAGFNYRRNESAKSRGMRNKRSVWTIAARPYAGAHFATFPPDLIRPCIIAGCPEGGTVLDPFFGSGTTGEVAAKQGCNCIGVELNQEYVKLAKKRLGQGSLLAASGEFERVTMANNKISDALECAANWAPTPAIYQEYRFRAAQLDRLVEAAWEAKHQLACKHHSEVCEVAGGKGCTCGLYAAVENLTTALREIELPPESK